MLFASCYSWSPRFARVIAWVAVGLGMLLALDVALRVMFPWDYFLWAEAPFLANMLKLAHGQAVWSSPWAVNTHIYSPGLEYLTYALLRPWGDLVFDIRACRMVTVLMGLGAAVLFARAMAQGAEMKVGPGAASSPGGDTTATSGSWKIVTLVLTALLLFRNSTSDVPHPDNLTCLYFALLFTGAMDVLVRLHRGQAVSVWRWYGWMAVAGLGVWIKQSAALGWIGVAAAAWRAGGMERGRLRCGLWVGGIVCFASVAWIWGQPWGKLYTLQIPSSHGFRAWGVLDFLRDFCGQPHRIFLLAGSFYVILRKNRGAMEVPSIYMSVWTGLAVFVVLPCLLPYWKTFGGWNNLVLPDLAALLLVWPELSLRTWTRLAADRKANIVPALPVPAEKPTTTEKPATLSQEPILLRGAAIVLLLLSLAPVKLPPLPVHYAYAQAVDERVAQDIASGRNVWHTGSLSFALRAGWRGVPLDLGQSYADLRGAGLAPETGTLSRINAGYYDVIYDAGWFDEGVHEAIRRNYRLIGEVPAPGWTPGSLFGFQGIMNKTEVYQRSSSAPENPGELR